jgi:hypothetical protein
MLGPRDEAPPAGHGLEPQSALGAIRVGREQHERLFDRFGCRLEDVGEILLPHRPSRREEQGLERRKDLGSPPLARSLRNGGGLVGEGLGHAASLSSIAQRYSSRI